MFKHELFLKNTTQSHHLPHSLYHDHFIYHPNIKTPDVDAFFHFVAFCSFKWSLCKQIAPACQRYSTLTQSQSLQKRFQARYVANVFILLFPVFDALQQRLLTLQICECKSRNSQHVTLLWLLPVCKRLKTVKPLVNHVSDVQVNNTTYL